MGAAVSLSVTVLGSAGMFATRDRAASGYLVEWDAQHVWLDCGAGSWQNLLSHVDYTELTGIILTHRHPDHTSDVFQALHARLYGQAEALPPIPLWAPRETLDACLAFSPGLEDAFDLREVDAGASLDLDDAHVTFFGMAHPPQTLGVRLERAGAVFAYSSDSGPGGDLAELASGADLFICEATFQDGDEAWEGHMRSTDAASIATGCGVRHLVLTHLPPNRDLGLSLTQAHHEADGIVVELAQDNKRYEVQ